MAVEKKSRLPLPAFVRNRWSDPVWSKVFSNVINVTGGTVLAFIWVLFQSLYNKIPFQQSFDQVISFLTRATPINNTILCLVGLMALWPLVRWIICLIRKENTTPPAPAAPLLLTPTLPATNPPTPIERFGFHSTDTNLLQAFKAMAGAPITSTRIDGHYGEIMEFDVNMGPDDLDCLVKLTTSKAEYISYVYIPISGFIFYLRVNVQTGNNKEISSRWIALRLDRSAVPAGTGQPEKAYPSTWKPTLGDWVSSRYHIPTLVAETFGPEGWTYHSLVGFRLRGKGKLESITLS